jgi:hypothetical protein
VCEERVVSVLGVCGEEGEPYKLPLLKHVTIIAPCVDTVGLLNSFPIQEDIGFLIRLSCADAEKVYENISRVLNDWEGCYRLKGVVLEKQSRAFRRLYALFVQCEMAVYANPEAVLVVEAIDAFLTIEQQYKVLPVLSAMFPRNKIVCTTYSPAVVSSMSRKECSVYITDEDGDGGQELLLVDRYRDYYGATLDRVAFFAMDMPKRLPAIEELLKQLRSAIARGQVEDAKRQVEYLKNFLDISENEFVRLRDRLVSVEFSLKVDADKGADSDKESLINS